MKAAVHCGFLIRACLEMPLVWFSLFPGMPSAVADNSAYFFKISGVSPVESPGDGAVYIQNSRYVMPGTASFRFHRASGSGMLGICVSFVRPAGADGICIR